MSAFINKHKALYKEFKSCDCPALQEMVYFTSDGLHHLLYNRRRPRSHNERHYRAALIPHLRDVIENSTQAIKKVKSNDPLVVTWELKHKCKVGKEYRIVKVILIKEGAGKVKFLSAMSKTIRRKHTKNPGRK